ncbi:MAG: hypothetical protein KDA60_19390, partial [Planctomycetales bacterium]|nr:hypothetical protein [Planctomycetales bacterium]
MPASTPITTLFLDIGGVLLTNGWDRQARARSAKRFDLDIDQLNQRHHLIFDAFECGTLSLDAYLERTVFYEQRICSSREFKDFMFEQSKLLPGTLDMILE